jgi:ParB-like chromosome segregation protein Spo0J
MRRVEQFRVEFVASLPGRRNVDQQAVERLASSISEIGLQTPITVRIVDGYVDGDGVVVDGQPVLVTGAHRLAAVRSLGWERVECFVMEDGTEIDAEMWEISENLHRAELSTLERSEQVARWVRLAEERQRISAQVAQKIPEGRGRPESGLSAASRDLGLDRDAVRRAVKISSISEQAKQAAIEAGIADNQSALLAVAAASDQIAEVARIQAARGRAAPPKVERKDDASQYRQLMWQWNAASDLVRRRFLEAIGA